jgi:GT2 family glycosyltransferase
MLKISIVIPTRERPQDLKLCLDSLIKQTYKNFEVIIVDGSITDKIKTLCLNYDNKLSIKYVPQKRIGFVGAVRDGLDFVNGDIFTRTDDDIIADPDWLREIAATFESSDSIGGVTGPTIIPHERLKDRDLIKFNLRLKETKNIFALPIRLFYHNYIMEGQPFAIARFFRSGAFSLGSSLQQSLEKIDKPIEVDYLESCNWSVKKRLLDIIGSFDPRFIGVGDYFEADAAYRIKKLGYKLIFVPKVKIKHMVSISGSFPSRSYAYARSRNFILFYYRQIKPNTIDKTMRFLCYLGLINLYFLYSFFRTGKVAHLTGIYGTLDGITRFIPDLFFYKASTLENKNHG